MLIFMPNKSTQKKMKKLSPMGTPQGQNTLVSLLVCAILGMILSKVLPFVIEKLRPDMDAVVAQEIGLYIALGVSGVVLVVSLLRPRKQSVSPLRKLLLKEQEKSDVR